MELAILALQIFGDIALIVFIWIALKCASALSSFSQFLGTLTAFSNPHTRIKDTKKASDEMP